jgi:hypothetical protein
MQQLSFPGILYEVQMRAHRAHEIGVSLERPEIIAAVILVPKA